jgi:chromatin remodeling complex protein RSC6
MGMLKSAIKRAAARRADDDGSGKAKRQKRRNGSAHSGIARKTPVSDQLYHFLTTHCGMEIDKDQGVARTDVVRALPKYIKENALNKGRLVIPDDNMKPLFPKDFDFADPETQVTFFSIYKFINHNFLKDEPLEKEKPSK